MAAGTVSFVDKLNVWYLTLYSFTNGTAVPFGIMPHASQEEAIADGNDSLKVEDGDWVEIAESEIPEFIATKTRNRWDVK